MFRFLLPPSLCLLTVAMFSISSLGINSASAKEKVVDRIVATVNGRIVTSNELNFMMTPFMVELMAQYPRRGSEFQKKAMEARENTIEELIERELILHTFDERGGAIPQQAVDAEVERFIKTSYGGDRARFLRELKKNNLTLRSYRDVTKRRLIVQAMRASKFDRGIAVTPSEARAEYNKVKSEYRDISGDRVSYQKIEIKQMPDNPSLTFDDQLDLADELVKRATDGESFDELAKEYSVGANADKGGHWKDLKRSDLDITFSSIVFDAPVNKIIGPLQGPGKFVIMKITSREEASPPPFAEVKEDMERRVKARKSAAPFKRWIEREKKRAIIRRKDKK